MGKEIKNINKKIAFYCKNNPNIFLGLAILLLLLIGGILGASLQNQKDRADMQKFKDVFNILNSDVVPSIISYGKVIEINGKEIKIAFNEDFIKIKIKDDTLINFLSSEQSDAIRTNGKIEDILLGDILNVELVIDSDGNFEGKSIINFSKR